jgi:hypothetical protein
LLLDPVQFLARLASLIPPPRHPLVRYFGVLSSASKWRPHVVPAVPAHRSQRSQRSQCEHSPAKDTKRSKLVVTGAAACLDGAMQSLPTPEPAADRRSRGCVQAATRYIPWADLLRRVHDLDALLCPRCAARLRFISAPTLFEDPPPDYDAA